MISMQMLLPGFGPLFSHAQNQESLTAQSCPYRMLDSAFEIQVDLERSDGGTMEFACSQEERNLVADLIQQGIRKTSKQLVDNKVFSKKTSSFGSSVCKRPEQLSFPSARRALEQSKQERNLRSVVQFFRYYGTMRCRLCDIDNTDESGLGDSLCSFSASPTDTDPIRFDKVTKSHQVHIGTPKNEKPFVRSVKMDFDQLEDQNFHVNLNYQYKLDFDSKFFANAPVQRMKYFQWPKKSKMKWSITKRESSETSSSAYTLILHFNNLFLASTTNDLVKIKTTYSGESATTDTPKLENVTVVYDMPSKYCPDLFKPTKVQDQVVGRQGGARKRLLTTANNAPIESPVSAPVSSPVSSPVVSAPVSARPPPKQIAKTKKTIKKKKKKSFSSSVSKQVSNINKKTSKRKRSSSLLSPRKAKQTNKKKKRKNDSTIPKRVGTKKTRKSMKKSKKKKKKEEHSNETDTTDNDKKDKNNKEKEDIKETVVEETIITENTAISNETSFFVSSSGISSGSSISRFGGTPVSISNDDSFMLAVNHALTLMLNRDLETLLPKNHCLNGKGIHAVVQLTPKPEWEKKLPTCTVTDP